MKKEAFKIEAGIPVPPKSERGRQCKYPFANMKKGDSFWAKTKPANLLGTANAWSKRRNYKWGWEARIENEGARIWRVK